MVGKFQFVLLLFCLSTFLTSFTQDDENIRISPKGDTIIIKPVPLAEIPNKIENTISRIKKIEENLKPTDELLTFDSIYDKYVADIKEKKARLESREGYYSLTSLETDMREWESLANILQQSKEKISDRVVIIQNDHFEVGTLISTWNITIKSVKEGGVPETVLTSEKDLLKRLRTLDKKVIKAQNEVLSMQNRLTDLLVTIDGVFTELDNKKSDLKSDYFRQDSPPIWRAGDTTTNYKNVRAQLVSNKDETLRNLTSFFVDNYRTIYIQILIFLLLWVSLYLLHRSAYKTQEEFTNKELGNSTAILSHYGISALILTLFASIWLYPSMPNTIVNILQFAYIIIALWLLPRYIDKTINKLLIGLLVLFFFNQFQALFFGKVLFARLVIFVEIFFAGYLLFILIDPKGFISKELKKYKWGFLLKIIPVFFLFLGLSLIGNIFGFVDLAILLNNVVVKTLFNLNILLLAISVLNRVVIILVRTPFMQESNLIKNHTEEFEKRFFQIIQIIGVFLWFKGIFRSLGFLEGLTEWFNEFINESYVVGSTSIKIGGIITFVLVIIVTIIIFRLVKAFLNEELFPRIKLPRGVPGSISMISGYLIAGYGLYIAISAAGADLSSFGLVAGALGVGIGFGLQGIVANFIAGLVLAFERPIQVGDEIQLPQSMGIVKSIGVRSTTIRTYDGSEVIIPNSDLITKDVINWTLTDRKKRRDINIGVAYGSNPDVVLELIRKTATEHPDVLKIPAPWALFDGFGDSQLNFRIRIWTTMDTGMTTKSQVTVAIYDALRKEGIEIPFPQRDLHIKSIESQAQKKLNKRVTTSTTKTTRAPKSKPQPENENDGDD
jgi:small-conductance mechanosensitive channel